MMDRIHFSPFFLLWIVVSLFMIVESTPISELEAGLEERQTVGADTFSVLSSMDVTSLRFFTYYASTAYCQPTQILNWTCGSQGLISKNENDKKLNYFFQGNCLANPWFHPIAAGGDGAKVQVWYVGYDTLLRVGCAFNFVIMWFLKVMIDGCRRPPGYRPQEIVYSFTLISFVERFLTSLVLRYSQIRRPNKERWRIHFSLASRQR